MKKITFLFVFCLVSLITAVTAFAQPGPGPGPGPGPAGQFWYGFTSPQGSSGQFGYGFNGTSQIVSVAQAQTYYNKSPVIIQGNIVQAIGGEMFQFRDSSGEILLKIGPREWQYYGTTISPSDTIEISGEVCYGNGWEPVHIHARFMRKL